MDDSAANRAQQAEIYGAPLSEVLGHCAEVLGLRQQGLAELLGLSAPMLSQLVNARRIKVGNPSVARRLRVLTDLVAQVDEGTITVGQVFEQMETMPVGAPLGGTTVTTRQHPLSDEVQAIFRAAAAAADYLAVAVQVEEDFPGIAELLRVYGAERADKAEEFTRRMQRR